MSSVLIEQEFSVSMRVNALYDSECVEFIWVLLSERRADQRPAHLLNYYVFIIFY